MFAHWFVLWGRLETNLWWTICVFPITKFLNPSCKEPVRCFLLGLLALFQILTMVGVHGIIFLKFLNAVQKGVRSRRSPTMLIVIWRVGKGCNHADTGSRGITAPATTIVFRSIVVPRLLSHPSRKEQQDCQLWHRRRCQNIIWGTL